MDTQTLLNILLSITTVYLALRNFLLTSKKDAQRESEEMTKVQVQLTQVMSLLKDLQRDVRTSTADFRELSDRVLILETRLDTALDELSKIKEGKNGTGLQK